jgi:hypothetical protein
VHFSKVGFDRSLSLSLPLTFPHVARMADNHPAAATLPGTPMLSRTTLAAFVVLVSQTGCVVVGEPVPMPAPVPGQPALAIPPGHMPPPGQCRIWFPGRPPGQQPPPGECRELQYRVPPDAVLVRG